MKRAIAWAIATLVALQLMGCSQKLSEKTVQERTQQARDVVSALESGDYDGVFEKFNTTMQQALPKQTLSSQWESVHAQYGTFEKHLSATTEQAQGYLRIVLVEKFEYASLSLSVVFDANGKVAGLFIAEAHNVDDGKQLSAGLVEQSVTVTTGSYKLSGKLTLPGQAGGYPAVVIVHGSGPMDMDGSVYNLKPYRDLAWGLAEQGIAVLRYDKRTLTYATSLAADETLTVDAETIDDAVSAVNLLKADKRIDASNVYVIGHSLGGMLLPRIQQKANAAGLIFLAAPARSLIDLYQTQMTYLTNLALASGEIDQQQANAATAQASATVQNIKGLTKESKLTSDALMGAPKAYWLDLQGYDQRAMSQQILVPMLLLQGERDYQVTMDEFVLWKSALKGKDNVQFQSFGQLGHMFTPGSKTPSPKDYKTPYVCFDASVIDAIAQFMQE